MTTQTPTRPQRRGWSKLALGALAVALTASAAAQTKVYDTGYEIIHQILSPSLYWIDNDRLLFAGIRSADMNAALAAKETDREKRLKKLYVWHASTELVTFYADSRSVCVANGIVRYTVRVDKTAGKVVIREGPFGAEKEVERPLPSNEELSSQGQMARVRSNLSCRTHLRSELRPPVASDRNVAVLRDGATYLDLGPNFGADWAVRRTLPRNLALYRADTGKAFQLPMTWEEDFSPSEVTYSAYRAAYVLRPRKPRYAPDEKRRRWSREFPPVVYLLWADGRTETVSIPYFPSEYATHPQPIKGGWVFGGGNFYRAAGLYLLGGGSVSKIGVGLVKEIAVSRDGCKAAVGIQTNHLEMGTPIDLRVFDFCTERR